MLVPSGQYYKLINAKPFNDGVMSYSVDVDQEFLSLTAPFLAKHHLWNSAPWCSYGLSVLFKETWAGNEALKDKRNKR